MLLVDADPSGSALEWSDLAAMDPRIAPRQAFPFRIVALPSRQLHRRLPEIARDDDVVIIDTPQIEDHAAIARSALRYADEIVIPCAPPKALDLDRIFAQVDWGGLPPELGRGVHRPLRHRDRSRPPPLGHREAPGRGVNRGQGLGRLPSRRGGGGGNLSSRSDQAASPPCDRSTCGR